MAGASGGDDRGSVEIRKFLDDALHSRLIDEAVYYRLVIELQHRTDECFALVRSEPGSGRAGREELLWPAIAGPPRGSVSAQTVPPPPKASVPIVPNWWKEPQPPPERRAQWAEWVGAVRALLASELALHGLAYLGVLLTFIGAFGFVVFAYGELDRSLRPVAEALSRSSASSPRGSCEGSRRRTSPPGWSSWAASSFRSSRTPRSWTTSQCRRTSSQSAAGRGARAGISGAVRRLRRMVGEAPGLPAPVPGCADGLAGRLGARARVRRRTGRGRRHPDAEPVADGRVRDRGGRLDRTRERVPDAPARARDADRRARRPCPRVRVDAGDRLRRWLGGRTRRPDRPGDGRGDRSPLPPPAFPSERPPALAWRSRSSSPSPWRPWFPTSSSAGRESRRRSRRSRCSSAGPEGGPPHWSARSRSRRWASGWRWRRPSRGPR